MRKTKSPHVVVVQRKWLSRPEIVQLQAEGHTVLPYEDVFESISGRLPDLILHESAHRWDEANWEAGMWPAVKARLRN